MLGKKNYSIKVVLTLNKREIFNNLLNQKFN